MRLASCSNVLWNEIIIGKYLKRKITGVQGHGQSKERHSPFEGRQRAVGISTVATLFKGILFNSLSDLSAWFLQSQFFLVFNNLIFSNSI